MSSGLGSFIGSIVGGAVTGGMAPRSARASRSPSPRRPKRRKPWWSASSRIPRRKPAAQLALEEALTARDTTASNAAMEIAKAQATVNLAEAHGNDRYSARWRPTAGWVCVAGLAYAFVLGPILTWLTGIIGAAIGAALPAAPLIEVGQLMVLLTGMLGLGVQRTVERTQGVPGAMPAARSPDPSFYP